jgi:hypothetical protein
MSLADVYQEALEKKYGYPKGWMANWPPGFDKRLGGIGRIHDGKLNIDGTLSDKQIEANEDPTPGEPVGPWTFQSGNDISIAIGTDASAPGWQWIRSAKAGLKIGFGKTEGVVLGVGSSHQETFLNIDALRPQLLAAAEDGRLALGQVVIVGRQRAGNGVQVTSEGQNAEFKATASAGQAGAPSLASFAADLSVHEDSHAVTSETYPNGFTVAFRVLKLGKRGWWWWKHITVEGVAPASEDEEEALLNDDDYFALLPSQDA